MGLTLLGYWMQGVESLKDMVQVQLLSTFTQEEVLRLFMSVPASITSLRSRQDS